MRSEFLPFSPPMIAEGDIEEVVKTLREGWITTGPRAARFETEFAGYVGAPAALALNSATSALHVALAVLGIGEGDAVIGTTMTFSSSIHVIEHQLAKPELIDEPRVWRLHGMSRDAYKRYTSEGSWRYDVVLPGFKYNMPDIQAALGLHQLARLEDMQRRREAIVAQYDEALGSLDALETPTP